MFLGPMATVGIRNEVHGFNELSLGTTEASPNSRTYGWDRVQRLAAWKRRCIWGLKKHHWFSYSAKNMQTADWNKYDDRLMKAAERGDVDKVSSILAKKSINACKLDLEGRSTFHVVASKGNLDCLNAILHHGADITTSDAVGRNVLHLSAKFGHSLCLQKLLQFNCPTENVDLQGRTALHDAAMSDCRSSVQLLCDHGASVNAKDGDGRTPLVLATQMCRPAICQLLIDKGADINAGDKQNKTALMLGCEYGCKDAVEVLLKNGADASLVDVLGHDSSYYARIGDNLEILALIRAALDNSSKGRESQKMGPLIQMKWQQQNSPEEGHVKSPRSTHSIQDLEMENEDLRERLWKTQQEQRILLDRVNGLQMQLSQREKLKIFLNTKEKEEEESMMLIEALKAKLRFYEGSIMAHGGLSSNGKEDILVKQSHGVGMIIQQHTQMSLLPSHLQPRSMLRPLELAGLGQAIPGDMDMLRKELDTLRRHYEGAKNEVTKLQQELAQKTAKCEALTVECEQTQVAADKQIRELEDALKDVQKRMFDSEGKVKQMQSQFLALKDHLRQEALPGSGRFIEELHEQLSDMKTKYEGASSEVGRLRNQLRQQELLAEELRREEVRLSQENRRMHEEKRTHESEREQATYRFQELQGQLKDMASQLTLCVPADRFGNMKSLLTNEVNEKAKQVSAVERELAEQQREAKELKDQISQLAAQVQSSQAEAKDALATSEQLQKKLATAVPQWQHSELTEAYKVTIAGLESQLADSVLKQKNSRLEAEQLLQNIDHLQTTYIPTKRHEKEIATLKCKLAELQGQLDELICSYSEAQAKTQELKVINDELKVCVQEAALSEDGAREREEVVRQQCTQLTDAYAVLEQQLANLHCKISTEFINVLEHREKVAVLESAMQLLTEQLAQAQAIHECDQGELVTLRAATRAQKEELDTIKEHIRLNYVPIASAEEQEQCLQATVSNLRQQLLEQKEICRVSQKAMKEEEWKNEKLQTELRQLREDQVEQVSKEELNGVKQNLTSTIEDLQEKLRLKEVNCDQELKASRQQEQQVREALEKETAASKRHLKDKMNVVQAKDMEISELQAEIQSIKAAMEEQQGRQVAEAVRAELEAQAFIREQSFTLLQEKYQHACEEVTKAKRKEQEDMEARETLQIRSTCIEQEIGELTERYDHSLATISDLQKSIQDSARQLKMKDNKITDLLNDVERLKQALNSLSQLPYSRTGPRSTQENQQTDVMQSQVTALQQKLADSDRQHQEVISVYRAHLLSAVQGHMDEDVQAELLQIIHMRRGSWSAD
uniref:Uveal autoantigen with coiled-coil domains and ankyrin repeats isoform X2 n=1 Tax=Geotrypetes seraphini TaxID=260995 RepID=A0A6P8NYB7_GEOSA|nr:uveal autoantigen with coiled-coil domains and ankyrin repeats isoform X2 [Geotrypetes seraphini]